MKAIAPTIHYRVTDFATPRFLRQQSLRHPDELTPWIIAVIWMVGLGLTAMAIVGLVVSVQWLWAHWLVR